MTASNLTNWPVYGEDEIAAVDEVLRSGKVNYWTGERCKAFEQAYAAHCGTEFAIALANGSVALELALEAAGIEKGDEVIVSPTSFIASASCVIRVGATPVFADIDIDSRNITEDSIRSMITPATKAIIAVHHGGWPCEMDALLEVAKDNDLLLIEDCAQAHGARYKDRPVGGIGHVGVFSFCQDKIISTGGEGGMLVTNDRAIWEAAWAVKEHGKNYARVHSDDHPPGFRWLHDRVGTNFRMTEMQAAIGLCQLQKLPDWKANRLHNARVIGTVLTTSGIVDVPQPPAYVDHAYYRLHARILSENLSSGWSRDRILKEVADRGIPVYSGSCPEIYNESALRSALGDTERRPNAASAGEVGIAFLVHPTLTENDLNLINETLTSVFKQANKN